MKIGFSLGRCVRDIVRDEVNVNDVAFIIAATRIETPDHLSHVINDYMFRNDYLYGLDENQCQEVALELWNTSRILQPRREGLHRHMQPEGSIWVDIFPTSSSQNQTVKNAWEHYRFLLHMVENVDNEAIEAFR